MQFNVQEFNPTLESRMKLCKNGTALVPLQIAKNTLLKWKNICKQIKINEKLINKIKFDQIKTKHFNWENMVNHVTNKNMRTSLIP